MFMRTAWTLLAFVVLLVTAEDQIGDSSVLVLLVTMSLLPFLEILSWATFSSDSVMGLSRLAIQTGVQTGILLNQTPRYHPGEETVLLVAAPPPLPPPGRVWRNWKKPSANLPLRETSLPPAASAWPAARVPPSAAAAGVCSEEKKMSAAASAT